MNDGRAAHDIMVHVAVLNASDGFVQDLDVAARGFDVLQGKKTVGTGDDYLTPNGGAVRRQEKDRIIHSACGRDGSIGGLNGNSWMEEYNCAGQDVQSKAWCFKYIAGYLHDTQGR